MPEQQNYQPINFENTTSPTGEPRMQPRRVPVWLIIAVTASAGLVAAGEMLPEQYELARTLCRIAAAAVAAGLGVASPGLRRHGGTLLVLLAVGLSLTGCSLHQHARPVGKPGPAACLSARAAQQAWPLVNAYIVDTLERQAVHSCLPPAPVPAE